MEIVQVKTERRTEFVDVTGAVANGRLCLGTWQAVYFCEFDGPRQREVWCDAGA